MTDTDQKNHIRLGIELKLFFFDDVSPGSAFFLPKGTEIINKLIDMIRSLYKTNNYLEVNTPVMCDRRLWIQSGHYEKYKENMFIIEKKDDNDNVNAYEFGLCAMNCPKHIKIFEHLHPSYADLPLRLADFGPLHRNEKSGALRGLTRVRLFHQDDAHVFCTKNQIASEIKTALNMLEQVYSFFSFKYELSLSTRPDNYVGDITLWDFAEDILKKSIEEHRSGPVKINEKDGAFYGPKIDAHIKDSYGKEHQLGTIQLDFNLPQRFSLKYTTESQSEPFETPVMIHRAILGSFERFIAILLEHTQGSLPLWLSPRKIVILPVSQKHMEYAIKIKETIADKYDLNIEIEVGDPLSKRILDNELMKYNYIVIVGNKEIKNSSVNVRSHGKIIGELKPEDFIEMLRKELRYA